MTTLKKHKPTAKAMQAMGKINKKAGKKEKRQHMNKAQAMKAMKGMLSKAQRIRLVKHKFQKKLKAQGAEAKAKMKRQREGLRRSEEEAKKKPKTAGTGETAGTSTGKGQGKGETAGTGEKEADLTKEAQAKLNAKCRDFQKDLLENAHLSQAEKLKRMKAFFSASEKSALWGRLKRMRAKAPNNVQNAWEQTKKTNQPKFHQNNMLMTTLTHPEDWQKIWVKEITSIHQIEAKGEKGEWVTRGMLEQRKGWAETNADIKKGKYEEWEDEWGDVWYRQVRHVDKKEKLKDHKATVEQSRETDQESAQEMLEFMGQFLEDTEEPPAKRRQLLNGQASSSTTTAVEAEAPQELKEPKEEDEEEDDDENEESEEEEDEGEESEEEGKEPKDKPGEPKETPAEKAYKKGSTLLRKLNALVPRMVNLRNTLQNNSRTKPIKAHLADMEKQLEHNRKGLQLDTHAKIVNPQVLGRECSVRGKESERQRCSERKSSGEQEGQARERGRVTQRAQVIDKHSKVIEKLLEEANAAIKEAKPHQDKSLVAKPKAKPKAKPEGKGKGKGQGKGVGGGFLSSFFGKGAQHKDQGKGKGKQGQQAQK